ncbi:MAG: N(4)-(beta-N-acetylglucosaminyl)-L-asparaginase, partial [Gemmatimonadetes bacterium]|nr:N(4)-(beta-N-acetylglucosaminyl)-L-asparaginase [Gemmatimonadota bacterium]
VEKAFKLITDGGDVLDALIAGVNIVELDPEDSSVGFGGLPNAEGVVQLDSCCMHGPLKRAGCVACLEGVRTPSLVARKVADYTDHHLLVGHDAQRFARAMGFTIEDDLNTERSRAAWLEWKRRIDASHFPTTEMRSRPGTGGDDQAMRSDALSDEIMNPEAYRARAEAGWRVALDMVEEGLLDPEHIYGTINCDGVSANGDICGVTTTSGLAWKIPGRVGDSPILGAGLYVDNDVGAAGSTGRGEANLYGLCSFLIVDEMRRGKSPKDAGMEALRRVQANTIERRLLDERGRPNFGLNFYIVNKRGEYAGVSMYAGRFAVCTENGPQVLDTEPLLTR